MTTPRRPFEELSPRFMDLTNNLLFGDIWERPGLSKRDRSLMIVAVLTALYRTDQLRGHIGRALDNGLSQQELHEIFLQMAFYAGWPVTVNALNVAKQVYEERGLPLDPGIDE